MKIRAGITEVTVSLTRHELHYLQFLIAEDKDSEPEYVSQRGAFKRFGQANVKRWERNGVILKYYRPSVTEYKLDDLRKAAANRQDYEIM